MVAGVANAAAADDGKKVNLNSYMAMTCILGGIGGLIFGYDIGISGGVTAMAPFLERFFPAVYRRQIRASSDSQYCKFNDFNLTAFTSSLYVAAFFASLVASFVTKGLGRKISMLLGGIVFFVGALLNMLAQHLWMLIVGRILLGIGVGFSVQSVPVYVSEMAPPQWRGSFNIVFQLSITVGIFAANLINYFTSKNIHYGWRVSLGGACVPAAIIIISSFFLPNTPNSLLEQGKPDEARAVLKRIRGASDVDSEFREIEAASVAAKSVPNPWKNIVLFQSIGIGSHASLLSAVVTGTVNVAATFVSIYGVDRWGRRFLFFQGGAQMLIFQILVAIFIGWKFGVSGVVTQLPTWYALVVVFFICLYVAAYAWSWGPLGFVVPSEIFPLEIRSAGQSINVSMNMLFTFLIAQLFLTMLCHMKFGLFLFFAFFLVVMTLFVYFFLPETKGIPIEAVHGKFREHWYWRRFVDDDGSESGRVKSSKRVEDFI
ncbi:Sugar transport protein 1 [Linum perenne]